jgi:hypothetical protein
LLQEYIQALGYPLPTKTGTTENYELNGTMTPSRGEPQNRANRGQYRTNDDATAYPQSGAYLDSGSSRTLSDLEPARSIAGQDSSISSNCRTRGIKRTQDDYVEDGIQQVADATTTLHVDERQSMPPPRLPHRRKQATLQKAVAASQMRNHQEQAQQLSYTHPRQKESEYYTMSGALRPESRVESGKTSSFYINRYPHQTRVVSTSWHQQDGLENVGRLQPPRGHNPTNEHYAQSLASRNSVTTELSSSEPEHLRNTGSLPIRAASGTSAHWPQNSIVPTTCAPSATPGRPFHEESQSGRPPTRFRNVALWTPILSQAKPADYPSTQSNRPPTRFRNGVPCTPIRSHGEPAIPPSTPSGRPPTRFRNGVPCTPILSRAEPAVYPSTQSGRTTTRFHNGVPCTRVLSRAGLAGHTQAQSLVSHFFSAPAAPSAYHTTNSGYNTHGRSLSARSSTANESFRMKANERNWTPHRSLNSLSFISHPYTSNNEPIGAQFSSGAAVDRRLSSSIIGFRMGGNGRRSVRR